MSRRYWTEEKIVTEIQKLHDQGEDLWYRAMERNHKDLIRAAERYFKGWKNAVVAAGLKYDTIKKRTHQSWTEDKILKKLHKLKNEHPNLKASGVQKMDKKLYLAIIRQYSSFNNAIARLNEKFSDLPGATPAPNKTPENMKIFTVRTRIRSERNVGEAILSRAKSKGVNIGNIQYPTILNGYIFVECESRETLTHLIKNIKNAQGLLNGETTQDEITKYIKTRKSKKKIYEGTHVEITDGQFKGEHAVIQHINERTDELTVELVDEILKIPIVIYRGQCRIIP
ncbi:transcription elongation factor Spt5 [[Eubacterium] cellulosolvens]